MATEVKSSRFLDQLRKQSDEVRKHKRDEERPVEDAMRDMDRQLWSAFRWLDEAMRHLDVIRPRVHHSFQLMGVLSIDAPRYERGFISFRRRQLAGMDLIERIEVFYRLSKDTPVLVKVQPGLVAQTENRLLGAQLSFQYDQELDEHRAVRAGVFTITPEITSSIQIEPDYRRQRVEVALHNIDRFESVSLDFAALGLTEAALEDLVHLILGEGNRFLRRAPLAGINGRRQDAALAAAAARVHVRRR